MDLQRQEPDDDTLIEAWCAGESWAGEILVRRHTPALRAFLRTQRPLEVEEAVQEVWLAMTSSRGRFQRRCSVRTFLLAIARNQTREARRRRLRKPLLATQPVEEVAAAEPAGGTMDTACDARKVVEALAKMQPRSQAVLVLYYFECQTAVRIGELLGIPENTARSRLRRARRVLRKAVLSDRRGS